MKEETGWYRKQCEKNPVEGTTASPHILLDKGLPVRIFFPKVGNPTHRQRQAMYGKALLTIIIFLPGV